MTTPVEGVALDSESVKLLRAGDVLRSITDEYYWRKSGAKCVVLDPVQLPHGPDNIHYVAHRPDGSEGLKSTGSPETFAFVSRPDVPALTDGPCIYAACDREETITRLEAQASAYKERVAEAMRPITMSEIGLAGSSVIGEAFNRVLSERRAILNGSDR